VAAIEAEKHIDHSNVAKHVILGVQVMTPQWIMLVVVLDGINLSDEGHFLATGFASRCFVALNPIRITTELCSGSEIVRVRKCDCSLAGRNSLKTHLKFG
jgi:hypothetical protein